MWWRVCGSLDFRRLFYLIVLSLPLTLGRSTPLVILLGQNEAWAKPLVKEDFPTAVALLSLMRLFHLEESRV